MPEPLILIIKVNIAVLKADHNDDLNADQITDQKSAFYVQSKRFHYLKVQD